MMLRRLLGFSRMFQGTYICLEKGIENIPEKERQTYNHLNIRTSVQPPYSDKRREIRNFGISRRNM